MLQVAGHLCAGYEVSFWGIRYNAAILWQVHSCHKHICVVFSYGNALKARTMYNDIRWGSPKQGDDLWASALLNKFLVRENDEFCKWG